MSDKRFYTYVWFTGNRPIYVGKGTGDRYMQHAEKAWFQAYDVEPRLFAGLTENEALSLEAALIERFGLDNLANRDKGSTLRCDLVGEQESFASSMEPQRFSMDEVTQRMQRIRELSDRRARRDAALGANTGGLWGAINAHATSACSVIFAISACLLLLRFIASDEPGQPTLSSHPSDSRPFWDLSIDGQIHSLLEFKTGQTAASIVPERRHGVWGYEAFDDAGVRIHTGTFKMSGGKVLWISIDGADFVTPSDLPSPKK